MKKFLQPRKKSVLLTAVIVLLGLICGSALGAFIALTHDLPAIQELENFQPSSLTRVVSAEGTLLAELFAEKRVPVSLDQIPAHLKEAVIATEDQRFYEHAGLDWRAIVRATIKDLLAGRYKEGGSTITQQLAKVLFLNPEKTLRRKLKEAILALQIERRYRKDEILALYLNQIYLGSGAYGVEAAANLYFGKHVWELDLAECALIAGLPRAPNRYSPLINPDQALERRATVLGRLLETGYISEEDFQQALKEPLRVAPPSRPQIRAPYFVASLRPRLEELLGENLLYRGGLTVRTGLHWKWQQAAAAALEEGLAALEERHRARETLGERAQGAVLILDARTGMIRAMVGGRNYEESQFNRAVQARRQPGSAFKPIIYAYALEQGYTQADRIWDAPVSYPQPGGERWEPQNYSGRYEGEITLRKALEISENIVAVKLLERLGPNPVVDFAHHLGISSELTPTLSLALGASEVTLLELVSAYQAFAHGGIWVEPSGIVEILDSSGKTLWKGTPASRVVLSRETAYILTDMLKSVIDQGTGRAASRLPWPVAGKTGTTEENRDALFVGYSPSVVTGVWVGYDSGRSLGPRETGARAALPVWMQVMEEVLPQTPQGDFVKPETITLVRMDPRTGKLAASSKEQAAVAAFVKGTEPGKPSHRGRMSGLEKFY